MVCVVPVVAVVVAFCVSLVSRLVFALVRCLLGRGVLLVQLVCVCFSLVGLFALLLQRGPVFCLLFGGLSRTSVFLWGCMSLVRSFGCQSLWALSACCSRPFVV